MQTLAPELANLVEYHESGGVCPREGCKEDAPYAVLARRRVAIPCRVHAEEERRLREADEVADRARRYMIESGATARLSAFSFDSYREQFTDEAGRASLAVAVSWAGGYLDSMVEDENGFVRASAPNLLFYGKIGSGKTGLAWAVIRHLIEHGVEAKHVNFRSLLEAMKDCMDRHEPIRNALRVGQVPVLVLDDLGSETPTKWAREQLLGIVDYRYEHKLPTIFVSNYDPDDLAKRLGHDDPIIGQRIVSRMTEGAIQHRFRADDRRKVAA